MVRGDEMQDELAPVVRQRLEFGVLLHVGQGAEFVPVAAKDRLIDRPVRLGERAGEAERFGVARCLEGALPALRLLAFIMQPGTDGESIRRHARKADSFCDA